MKAEWSVFVTLVVSLIAHVNYTDCQFAQQPPYGVYPPSSFGAAGGGGSLLPFPLFPPPCEMGYVTCEGPAGYIITNINIPGPPAIPGTPPTQRPPSTPMTTPRPTTPMTTPRPTTPTTRRPAPASSPRPPATSPRPTQRPISPAQIPSVSQQIVYMYPQWCNMWCRLMQRPQPVFRPQPCLLYNWLGFGGPGGGGGFW